MNQERKGKIGKGRPLHDTSASIQDFRGRHISQITLLISCEMSRKTEPG
jgi:hypothetical protein